jgi:hypothetical protein
MTAPTALSISRGPPLFPGLACWLAARRYRYLHTVLQLFWSGLDRPRCSAGRLPANRRRATLSGGRPPRLETGFAVRSEAKLCSSRRRSSVPLIPPPPTTSSYTAMSAHIAATFAAKEKTVRRPFSRQNAHCHPADPSPILLLRAVQHRTRLCLLRSSRRDILPSPRRSR